MKTHEMEQRICELEEENRALREVAEQRKEIAERAIVMATKSAGIAAEAIVKFGQQNDVLQKAIEIIKSYGRSAERDDALTTMFG